MIQLKELSLSKTIKIINQTKVGNKMRITCGRTSYFVKCTVTAKVIAANPRCAICGAAATKVFLCEHEGHYYISFYTEKNGKLILFTKDHIIPRSQGGGNGITNLQTCCEVCNAIKSDIIIDNPKESQQILELKQEIDELKRENKRLEHDLAFKKRILSRQEALLTDLFKIWIIRPIIKYVYNKNRY